jgi:hypothetical protein
MHLFLFNDQLIVASAYRDKFKTFRKLAINEHFHVVDEVRSPRAQRSSSSRHAPHSRRRNCRVCRAHSPKRAAASWLVSSPASRACAGANALPPRRSKQRTYRWW